MGANGAGKTTTLRAIMGLISYDTGAITYDGNDISSQERKQFGYMPEERGLFAKDKVISQVQYFAGLKGISRESASERLMSLLDSFQISGFANEMLGKLSLGNQQRIQLIVALINNPQFLFLDEPFSGLDPIGIELMTQVLRERAKTGAGIIFSSHQLSLVEQICDRVIILDSGQVVLEGSVTAIKRLLPSKYRVRTLSLPVSWVNGWDVQEITRDHEGVVFSILDQSDSYYFDRVLRHILSFGPVSGITESLPSLVEIYRSLVRQ